MFGSGKKICSDNKARTRIKRNLKGDAPAIRIYRYHRSRAAVPKASRWRDRLLYLGAVGIEGQQGDEQIQLMRLAGIGWIERVLAICAPTSVLCSSVTSHQSRDGLVLCMHSIAPE
jgi:hypothetical protein